jgi:hypothetical protein
MTYGTHVYTSHQYYYSFFFLHIFHSSWQAGCTQSTESVTGPPKSWNRVFKTEREVLTALERRAVEDALLGEEVEL